VLKKILTSVTFRFLKTCLLLEVVDYFSIQFFYC